MEDDIDIRIQVACPDNVQVAEFLWRKRKEMAQGPKGISEKIDLTLSKALSNICNSKTPIKTLKDLSLIKGVGKWILKLMQLFFDATSGDSLAPENEVSTAKGKRNKGSKRYVPQKNSVAYALLVTLYRATSNEKEFMHKQELIDAAEASGLSRVPIMPEKGKGKPGQYGSSPREWYSGWNCMKTLITKGMVVKSNCPARYMLTEEGKETARECLLRSGLHNPIGSLAGGSSNSNKTNMHDSICMHPNEVEVTIQQVCAVMQKKTVAVPPESLDRFIKMGYSEEQVVHAFCEVSETSHNKDITSLWPSVLCRLREGEVYGSRLESQNVFRESCLASSSGYKHRDDCTDLLATESRLVSSACDGTVEIRTSSFIDSTQRLRACSSVNYDVLKRGGDGMKANFNVLAMPPLMFGERFKDAYEVVLILDDREKFATQGSKSRKIIENIQHQFKISIEVRRLPVGDGIWIARHKQLGSEYVLDFIVERKKVDDLKSSIRDSRYKDQKVRLLRCGLKKMIYLVEGDLDASDAAGSVKTACFTTEILEGFDLQRTSGLGDTLRKYGYLTHSIEQYYRSVDVEEKQENPHVCPPFDEFIKRCQDLEKMTVSDVFATQLMQVPQVTEEVVITILDMYPTLLSLARAYALLDGETSAQEEMLKKQSNNVISGVASRNIFKFIWGSGSLS